jgi:hypothetical protein
MKLTFVFIFLGFLTADALLEEDVKGEILDSEKDHEDDEDGKVIEEELTDYIVIDFLEDVQGEII